VDKCRDLKAQATVARIESGALQSSRRRLRHNVRKELLKLAAARSQSRAAWRLVVIEVAEKGASLSHKLVRDKLKKARRRAGRYFFAPI
jgi:hypothetical protein